MNATKKCLFLGLVSLVALGAVDTARADLVASLVSYWNFDETATGTLGAYDLIGNNDGTFGGTATRTAGLLGTGAAEFFNTTGDTVNVGNGGGSFSFTTGVTVEALIQPTWSGGSFDYDEIFRKEDGGNRILLSFQNDPYNGSANPPVAEGPVLSFGLNIGGGYGELDMPLDGLDGRPTLEALSDGAAHHVVATYDAATGRKAIWIDGSERFGVDYGAGVGMFSGGVAAAEIGNSNGGEPFTGVIDEVAIYGAGLTAEQVAEHYSNFLAGTNYFDVEFDQILGVRVGASALISQLDYSDTFTLTAKGGIEGRVVNTYPVGLPGINVERNYENPAQAWTDNSWSISDDADAIPGTTTYAGGSGAGSNSGMTQTGAASGDWGIEYGMREDFVVQTDFVQTSDRVDVTIGGVRDDIFDSSNLSVFFRQTGHGQPEIGLFNSSVGEVDTGLTSGIASDGRWFNYAVRVDAEARVLEVFVNQVSRGSIDLDTVGSGALAGVTLSTDAVGVGYSGGDRGWSDNFQVGAGIALGVEVGSSALISELDYSDSFALTAKGGIAGRVANTFPVGTPGIDVEGNYGNPPQTWTNARWSVSYDPAVLPGAVGYAGGSGSGSTSGITQTGGGGTDWGIEYGLRDDFVVQTDFVQTTDRIDVTIGAARDNIFDAGNLSVFFRQTGHGAAEIGLFNSAVGEVDTGLTSGIDADGQWHNYAVRVNVPDRMLEFYVDQVRRGGVELDTIGGGALAGVPLSAAAVSVGYAGGDRGWSDNFQVGRSIIRGVTVGTSTLIDTLDYSDTFTAYDYGGLEDRDGVGTFPLSIVDYPENGTAGEGLAVENNHGNTPQTWSDAMWSVSKDVVALNGTLTYPGGSGRGSATGMTQRGGAGDWGIEYGLRTDFVVQTDFVQTADRVDIAVGGTRNTIFDPSGISVFFRQTGGVGPWGEIGVYNATLGEFDTGLATGISGVGQWHNYAVHYDLDNDLLEFFVDERSMGVVDLTTFAAGVFAGLTVSGAAVSVGSSGSDRGWSDNFQVGSAADEIALPGGVLVGRSQLMDTPDYSDRFRLADFGGVPERQANVDPVAPSALNVESSYDNPPQAWTGSKWILSDDVNATSGATAFPGGSGTDSASGLTHAEGTSGAWGIEYGLASDFVVQADFVQTSDRVGITTGGIRDDVDDPSNLSVFFRKTGHASSEISLYNAAIGEHNTGLSSGIGSDGQWHNYAVRCDVDQRVLEVFVDEQSRGIVDLDSVAGGAFSGLALSGDAVSVGYAGGDRGWSDNFQVGPGLVNGVAAGSSSLIDTLDYSDSFTLTAKGGNPGRVANVEPVGSPGINVEDNYVNAPRVWTDAKWAISSDTTAVAGSTPYAGMSGSGSASGITQTSGASTAWGIEYGLRADFVVQTDFVQTSDRVGITFGGVRDDVDDPSNLSVLFRRSGHASSEITLYNATLGEHDTELRSGIVSDGKWHNYAVRVNGFDRVLEVFVDEVSRGMIDLDTFAGGTFAGTTLSGNAVSVGYAGGDRGWSDNFQVGSGLVHGARVGTSTLIGELDYSDSFTLTLKGGGPGRDPNLFPVGEPGINIENNHGNPHVLWTDSMWSISSDPNAIPGGTPYLGGSGAGSASGMTQRGGGSGDWGIEYGLRNDFVVQTDFVQTADRVDIYIGGSRDSWLTDPDALAVFFRVTDHPVYPEIGLYNYTIDTGIPGFHEVDTGLLSGIPEAGEWHNYAVRFNLDERDLSVYVDQVLRGIIDLDTVAGGLFAGLIPLNAAVGVGYAGGDRGWSDNFQVGSYLEFPAVLTSVRSGDWLAPATWNHGEATPNEEIQVVVVQDHEVLLAADAQALSLSINNAGKVVVGEGHDLSVVEGLEVAEGMLVIQGTVHVPAAEVVMGTLDIGPTGSLTASEFEFADEATYMCRLAGSSSGRITVTDLEAVLAGMLTAQASSSLDNPKDQTLRIIEATGEAVVTDSFETDLRVGDFALPSGDPDRYGTYLGSGVWFGNDKTGDGILYVGAPGRVTAVDIAVFQAKAGDCNGDRSISFADFNDLANNYTGALAPGVGGKEWRQGDYNGDADVDFGDFNDLANNYTGAGVEYGPGVPASGAKTAPGEASLIVYLADVTGADGVTHAAGDVVLSVDTEGDMRINGYEVYSPGGLLVPDADGAAYPLVGGAYMEGSAAAIVAFSGVTSPLIASDDQDWTLGWKYDVQAKAAGDLEFSYGTAAGVIAGNVLYVVPEPGTLLLLACGALGLLLIAIRRRQFSGIIQYHHYDG